LGLWIWRDHSAPHTSWLDLRGPTSLGKGGTGRREEGKREGKEGRRRKEGKGREGRERRWREGRGRILHPLLKPRSATGHHGMILISFSFFFHCLTMSQARSVGTGFE